MGFLYSQLFVNLPYPTGSYKGKSIIVTGSNVGLGKEAARHFVRMGASRVILAVRNLDKGSEAKADIESSTNCGKHVIQVWELDMASFASVQDFGARVERDLDRVDICLANAGIAPGKYATAEGNEASITVNVISTILMMALILPKMKLTAATYNTQPTFTVVSSDVHGHTAFPQKLASDGQILPTINDKEFATSHWDDQYPISKLLEVYAVRAIAEIHGPLKFPVTINTVNPGLCHSELGRDFPTIGFWLIKLILARSTEVGSRTLVHAASQGPESHGQYMSDCGIGEPASVVTDEEGRLAQGRVWAEIENKLENIKSGITRNFY